MLDDLAAMVHMSRRAYIRTFHAATGQSPIHFLIQTRIRRAADLLRKGEGTITQIALETGFEDSNYFNSSISKSHGTNPSSVSSAIRSRRIVTRYRSSLISQGPGYGFWLPLLGGYF